MSEQIKEGNTLIAGNKLIAEFAGFRIEGHRCFHPKEYYDVLSEFGGASEVFGKPMTTIEKLKFHSSWDWLMPVVKKINSLELKKKGEQLMLRKCDHYTRPIFNAAGKADLESLYPAVIQFIKWYNSTL